jgi:hypothetical protein
MANFAGVYQAFYLPDGSKGAAVAAQSLTVSDGRADTAFSLSEGLTVFRADGVIVLSGTFAGTTSVAGVTLVVVKASDGTAYLIGGTQKLPYGTFSSSIAGLTINDGPFTVCFLGGTAIAMPTGSRPVEDLAVGDLVTTADGRTAPVKWVGVQTVVTVFADPLRTLPVHIRTGALGEGLPLRDLFVSPDHALFLDGVLVQAGALVNGTTIRRVTAMPERFTYFHVELADHALILAEGVPAETFVDNVTRRRFDNFAEYAALHGEAAATLAELDMPRVKSARQLPAGLRARLTVAASLQAA